MKKVISALAKVPSSEASRIIRKYQGKSAYAINHKKKRRNRVIPMKLPSYFKPLQTPHKKYLISRGLNPRKTTQEWGLLSSGVIGPYRHRIVIPFFIGETIVSFTARALNKNIEPKYKAASEEMETYSHKLLLYGEWKVSTSSIVVVEGPVDVWKMGPGAVAITGINFSEEQISRLAKYDQIFIMFDNEEGAAQEQAEKLLYALSPFTETILIEDYGAADPGELSKKEAKKIMKELLG